MTISTRVRKWSNRTKHAVWAFMFLVSYGVSMVAPFVPAASAATNDLSVSTHQGQEYPGLTYTSGNVTTYKEGDTIKFRFTLQADAAASGKMTVNFSDYDGNCHFFTNSFTLGAVTNVYGVTPSVTLDGVPTSSGTEWKQVLNVTASSAGKAIVNYTLKLSQEAGECNGSSQHSRLDNVSGDFKNIGQQNVPVPANQIIELPEIVVEKWVDTDGNGTVNRRATAGEWSFSLDNGNAVATDANGKVTFTNVTPNGNHTVTESNGPSSQTFLSGSGTSCKFYGATATATVASGTTATDALCVFNNTVQKSTLTLVKNLVKDNGGTAAATDWTLSASGPTPISGATGSASVTNAKVSSGTYTLSEAGGPSGYTASSWVCTGVTVYGSTITLAQNQSATCTITNNDQPGTLIVNKVLVNDNGGTKTVQSFSYKVNNGAPVAFEADGSNSQSVNAGQSSVAEVPDAGYTTTYANSLNGNGNCTNLFVPNGGTVTCTITNNDVPAHLTLVKNLVKDNGGTASATDWMLNAAGPTPLSGVTGSAAVTNASVNAGTYNLTETGGPAGYTASNWVCTGGAQNGASITLTEGQNATCTITNDDIPPYLQLIKTVTNDNGGTAANTSWTLIATGSTQATSFQGTSGVSSASVPHFLTGSYTLTESAGPTGYSAGSWNCTGGSAINGVIQLVLGQSAVCTINNNDVAPKLKLVKQVINDNGGTRSASQWTLSATGPTSISGAGGVTSGSAFSKGTYTLSESGPSDYSAGSWSCTGKTVTNSQVVMNLGDDVTCTIVNNDKAPKLTLIKKVINDNGGTKKATDWRLSAHGPDWFSGYGQVSSNNIDTGTYTLSESGPSGYVASSWDCGYTSVNMSKVTLKLGDDVTCTITNNDKPGSITVIKNVDDGFGHVTKDVTNWTWNYSGPMTKHNLQTGSGNAQQVNAGTYTVSENQKPGYHVVASSCNDGGYGNPYENHDDWGHDEHHDYDWPSTSEKVSVGLGQHVTCEFTNKRDTGTITVHKKIGDKVDPQGWTWWLGDSEGSNAMGSTEKVTSGWYWFGENQKDGYSFDSLKCMVDRHYIWVNQDETSKVYVGKDDHVECTFTNSRDSGDITIIKDAQPDSTQGFEFTIEPVSTEIVDESQSYGFVSEAITGQSENVVSNPTTSFTLVDNGTNDGKNVHSSSLETGKYRISESALDGWDLSGISCGEARVQIEDNAAYIYVTKGMHVTCTFTNTKRAQLTIVKDTTTNSSRSFNFTSTLPDGVNENAAFSLVDDGTGTLNSKQFSNLLPGTYTVTETATNSWRLDNISCTGTGVTMTRNGYVLSVTLAVGAVASCTFVNAFVPQVLAETTTLVNTGADTVIAATIALTLTAAAVIVSLQRRKAYVTIRKD